MGTVTVTTAGFSNLPATAPAGWPSYVVYPANAPMNGSHAYTVSDADWVRLITWTAASQFAATPPSIPGAPSTPANPTALQILLAWVQVLWSGTQQAEQQYGTTPPVKPPPIVVT